jgi:uncharacterized protein
MKKELKILSIMITVFIIFWYLPVASIISPISEALYLLKWYAREHIILCLIPAFFIAGAIGVFISKNSVMKYLGASANKFLAYGVASVSGSILAVCSCTILPLFSGIYKMGAGLGPAISFLYSGPAINVLAIILTAKILGAPLGIARAVGAILFSIIIGLLMSLFFKKELVKNQNFNLEDEKPKRSLFKNAIFFFVMVAILVFANFSGDSTSKIFSFIAYYKWVFTLVFYLILLEVLRSFLKVKFFYIYLSYFLIALTYLFTSSSLVIFIVSIISFSFMLYKSNTETKEWLSSTWTFAKQILPLLFFGVLIAGFLLGRPDGEGIIPKAWIVSLVGGNSLYSNLFASLIGSFMYFATLTEVPILQGLISSGMGKGPALALLLSGPALSLPNMLIIRSVIGTKKTLVFVCLVVALSTIAGLIFGSFYN